jgi:putative aldouronate transport system permease protein
MIVGMATEDRIFIGICYVVLAVVGIACFYPLWFVVIASLSDPFAVSSGEVLVWVKDFTLSAYKVLFESSQVLRGFAMSFFYMTAGVTICLTINLFAAYALSRRDLVGRKVLLWIFVFTMYFSGGLIPQYMLVTSLGLNNTIWPVLLLPTVNVWYLIMTRTFFMSNIPQEFLDSAHMDGCSNIRFFFKIVIPISPAITAVMALYYGLLQWNQYFYPFIYLQVRTELWPIQLVLRQILRLQRALAEMEIGLDASEIAKVKKLADSLRYSVIVAACLPIGIIYPFAQRFFVKGVMVGSIKG